MQNVTLEILFENGVLLDSMMFRMVQITQGTSKPTAEFKQKNSLDERQAIKRVSNRIVPDYGRADMSITHQTAPKDFPKWKEYLLRYKRDDNTIFYLFMEAEHAGALHGGNTKV